MRIAISIMLTIISTLFCTAQKNKGYVDTALVSGPQQHYLPEYTFDVPSDPAAWSKLQSGLHAAFGSTNELYLRCEIPTLPSEVKLWKETGWRGERLNAQILLWSRDTIEQIRFKVGDLITQNGRSISAKDIKVNMVRYVISSYPYGALALDCASRSDSAWLMPDRFESFERFDLPANTVRPVWISCDIPRDAAPGVYHGSIEVISLKEKASLDIVLTVQNQILPAPGDWKFRLDLWQNPWVIAWYYHVEPWSTEHMILLKNHLKLYADAGGKYITTYAVHSPWSDNSYMIEGTMIDWVKKTDGSWNFDYSIFDKYVQLCMETGITKAITVYTPIPWGHRFRYMDEESGNYIYVEWTPGSEEFRAFWNVFLDDLKAHLNQKGWLNRTYLGINENTLEHTLAAINVIKEHSKDWKITYAGDWHEELAFLLDDYSTVIAHEPPPQGLRERTARNLTTTFYVCCTPPKPNNFVFSPPVEGRYISWYAIANGYDGFLRWAYDAWTADPVRDARHTFWPAGDCFLVYPGANSSIRLEKLKEGIQDYEKILMLRSLVSESNDKEAEKAMRILEEHLKSFVQDPDYSKRTFNIDQMSLDIEKGDDLIRQISDILIR